MKVIDTDLGWNDIVKKAHRLNGRKLKAGVLEPEGLQQYKTGTSVVSAARINHFGSPSRRIPARPFLAIATDENKGWQSWVADEIGKTMDSPANSIDNALESVGTIMVADIRRVIGSGKLKPNAIRTIKKKHHDMPLIGMEYKLMSSIRYEVE